MKNTTRYRSLAVLLCLALVAPACGSDGSKRDASDQPDAGSDAGTDTSNDVDTRQLCDPLHICPVTESEEYTEQMESDADCPASPPETGGDCGTRNFSCYYCLNPDRAESTPNPDRDGVDCISGSWAKGGVSCGSP